MSFPWLLSLVVGFLSLSQEILWVRLIGFVQGGAPVAFSFVLACYLAGIALGAGVGKFFCDRFKDLYLVATLVLLVAALTDPLPPFLGPWIAYHGGPVSVWNVIPPALGMILTAAIKSTLFPIVHHLGSNQSGSKVGSSVSNIYFGNIIGSTLGPIVTGFFLLDFLSTEACFRLIGAVSLGMAILCALRVRVQLPVATVWAATGAIAAVLIFLPAAGFVVAAGERFADGTSKAPIYGQIDHVVENKHGVIHTVALPGRADDMVYGGNIYDGRVNVDIKNDTNGLMRLYLLAAVHPSPKRILVIGMSTGAWTKVLVGFPGTVQVDVVEINSGYVDLMRKYPEVVSVLTDPKDQIHIDDGRRWLKRNPKVQYDLIVMNTSFHWRANMTNLLSQEFMRELDNHLAPGGIVTFNTTRSLDAFVTAASVFPFVYRYAGFAYASMSDFKVPPFQVAEQRLRQTSMDGSLIFTDSDFEPGAIGSQLARTALQPVQELMARYPSNAGVITDANMLSEFRHGKRIGIPFLSYLLPPVEVVLFGDR